MEEVRYYILIPILEDNIGHVSVVFRVSESGWYPGMLGVEVTEAGPQRKKEKSFSILETGVVLEYYGTQFVRHRCQTTGTLFPPD